MFIVATTGMTAIHLSLRPPQRGTMVMAPIAMLQAIKCREAPAGKLAAGHDFRNVHEDILAADVGLNEAISLRGIEKPAVVYWFANGEKKIRASGAKTQIIGAQ